MKIVNTRGQSSKKMPPKKRGLSSGPGPLSAKTTDGMEVVSDSDSCVSGSDGERKRKSRSRTRKSGGSPAPAGGESSSGKQQVSKSAFSYSGVVSGGVDAVSSELSRIFEEVTLALMNGDLVDRKAIFEVTKATRRYEGLVMALVDRVARLEEKVRSRPVAPGGTTTLRPADAPTTSLPQPPQTWSVVVKAKDPSVTPEEVVGKVMKEVGPSLGVRVHGVKAIKSGGAVIRTPSVAEVKRLVENKKFEEVGLDVALNPERGPRVEILGVDAQISPEELMEEVYEKNLKEKMTREEFQKSVSIASKPWSKEEGRETVNVVLNVNAEAARSLLAAERCYVKWFAFRVRSQMPDFGCRRCRSYDHRVAECRMQEQTCNRCGESGHIARNCNNAVKCRDCAYHGKPSAHRMMSMDCPKYARQVVRAQARH